jgi:restriction endonuclease S subunit
MIADITRDNCPVYPQIDFLTEEGAKRSRPIKKGTLVMAVSGNVGLTSIAGVDCCIHDGFIALLNLDKKLNPSFLREYLESIRIFNLAKSSGAIWKNLTTHEIKNIDIVVPPIEIQNRFEAILEQIAAIKHKQQNLANEMSATFNSLLSETFKEDGAPNVSEMEKLQRYTST